MNNHAKCLAKREADAMRTEDARYEAQEATADYKSGLIDNYRDSMDIHEIAEVIEDNAHQFADIYVLNITENHYVEEVEKFIKFNAHSLANLWTVLKNKEIGVFGVFKQQMEEALLTHAETAVEGKYGI